MSHFNRIRELTTLNATASILTLAMLRMFVAIYLLMAMPTKLAVYNNGFSIPQLLVFLTVNALATAMLLGYRSQICTLLLAVITCIFYYNQSYGWPTLPFALKNLSSNTFERDLMYTASFSFLLSFTPCGRVLSLDSIRFRSQADQNGLVDSSAIFGMRTLLITVYFWTALSKYNSSFLSGAVFESIIIKYYTGSFFYSEPSPDMRSVLKLLSMAAIVFELALSLALLFKWTRRYAIFCGISMHIGLMAVLPVSHFSFIMISSYLLFFDQEAIEQARARLLGVPVSASG